MRNDAISMIVNIKNISISSGDLGALTVLEGKDAFRLSLAISLLDSLKDDLRDEQIRNDDRIMLEQEAEAWVRRLDRISRIVRVVSANFLKITDEQAPHPNDDEVWGEQDGS